MNVGIILAAGKSSRFPDHKQLHLIDGKELVAFSTEVFCKALDETIIVTNSECYRRIKKLFKNVEVVKNDIDCRIASIQVGLKYIDKARNVIIHDAARPFVTRRHVTTLLAASETYLCSQFYFKLVNGLLKIGESGAEVVSREQYVELVTPQIIDYRLARDLFSGSINSNSCEVIPLLDKLKIKYNLIEGFQRHLRKITTPEDLED